jgi:hypothetical protein
MARSISVLIVLLQALFASSAVAQLTPDANGATAMVEPWTAKAHLLVPIVPLRSDQAADTNVFGNFVAVEVEIVIDQAGRIASADVISGPDAFYSRALAQAQRWTFRPIEKDGSAVAARARIAIPVLPREALPAVHRPFPMVGDSRSVRITRRDTACLGTCPVFEIAVDGDGDVTYDGEAFVAVTGRHHDHVPPDAVARLVRQFRRADFFSLRDEYVMHVTDLPSCIISISVGDQRKSLVDYDGEMVGMPAVVSKLETSILDISGAAKWTEGSP